MSEEVYKDLLGVMKKRGGGYSGMDIPEFYELVEELFTPEEAEINNAMPKGPFTAKDMAREMGRDEVEIWKNYRMVLFCFTNGNAQLAPWSSRP